VSKATTNIATLSPFHNIAAGDLVDQLGTVKAQIADLETREKALRDELIHRGGGTVDGAAFSASITEAVRWTLDAKTVKAEMGEAWWNPRCRQSLVTTVAVKPLAVAVRLAA
jgi:hypothetical protein